MKMKTICSTVLLSSSLLIGQAAIAHEVEPLSSIIYQVSKESWVETKTALLTVDINMVLDRKGLVVARRNMMGQLQHLAKSDWQIIHFNRSRDQSGLERVNATATTRVAENLLEGIQESSDAISQPGAKYTIRDIDFSPSLAEVEVAKQKLRLNIMDDVKHQLVDVRKIYSNDNYVINRLSFVGEFPMIPRRENMNFPQSKMMTMEASAPALQVSQKIVMTAMVDFAVPNK